MPATASLEGQTRLPFTAAVETRTAPIYDRLKDQIPPVEWELFAPEIDAINRLKRERNAIILAHNYQSPEIFHGVADIVGDSLALAQIFRNDQVWLTDVPSPGSQQDCPEAAGLVNYRIKVDSEFSGSAEAGQAVNVLDAAAVPLPAEPDAEPAPADDGGGAGG